MSEALARQFTYFFALICVSIEIIELLKSRVEIEKLWPWEILRKELDSFSAKFLNLFFARSRFSLFLILYLALALRTAILQSLFLWIVVCTFHLILSLRFRGRFNGGSDSMVFQVLLGCVLLSVFEDHVYLKFIGFYYLGLQLIFSYFIAGVSKLKQKNWPKGETLKRYFILSAYPVPTYFKQLVTRPILLATISWSIMVFELSFSLSLFNLNTAIFATTLGAAFHLANFLSFGLNRFFWAWVATYPSVLFIASKFSNSL